MTASLLISTEGVFVRAETRHQLKQDSFSKATFGAAERTVHWSEEHKTTVIAVAVIALILIGGGFGGWYYLTHQEEKASFDLSQAMRTLDTPVRPEGVPPQPDAPSFGSEKERATLAQKQFQTVIDKYPHTKSSDFAHYFMGVTAATLGDNAAAETRLKDVASWHNDDLASLAKMSLATVYRNTNRNKDAIDIYKKLIDKPTSTVGKVTAQMELAATYRADNQPIEAKRLYEQVQKENPKDQVSQMAAAKLQELK